MLHISCMTMDLTRRRKITPSQTLQSRISQICIESVKLSSNQAQSHMGPGGDTPGPKDFRQMLI